MSDVKLTPNSNHCLKRQHNDTKIAHFLKVARSSVVNVQKVLEAAGGNPISVAKRETHVRKPSEIRRGLNSKNP